MHGKVRADSNWWNEHAPLHILEALCLYECLINFSFPISGQSLSSASLQRSTRREIAHVGINAGARRSAVVRPQSSVLTCVSYDSLLVQLWTQPKKCFSSTRLLAWNGTRELQCKSEEVRRCVSSKLCARPISIWNSTGTRQCQVRCGVGLRPREK